MLHYNYKSRHMGVFVCCQHKACATASLHESQVCMLHESLGCRPADAQTNDQQQMRGQLVIKPANNHNTWSDAGV